MIDALEIKTDIVASLPYCGNSGTIDMGISENRLQAIQIICRTYAVGNGRGGVDAGASGIACRSIQTAKNSAPAASGYRNMEIIEGQRNYIAIRTYITGSIKQFTLKALLIWVLIPGLMLNSHEMEALWSKLFNAPLNNNVKSLIEFINFTLLNYLV